VRHDHGSATLTACIIGIAGILASTAGHLIAQAAPGPTGTDIATWIQGGGAATAVGVLGYIARLMATGRLVARDPAEQTAVMRDLIEKYSDTFEKLAELTDQSHKREDSFHRLLVRRLEGKD
jgi:hypothetical protein